MTVNLSVVDSNNCNQAFQTNIKTKDCLEDIIIPNVFTPNGDGKNDFWVIEHLAKYPKASVEVFTRWGELVYKSIGYSDPWDGFYNGVRLSPGCYFYIIILNTGKEAYKGPVMIY
jgi:gliding motility-associated-like protein